MKRRYGCTALRMPGCTNVRLYGYWVTVYCYQVRRTTTVSISTLPTTLRTHFDTFLHVPRSATLRLLPLQVRYIDATRGRGLFATAPVPSGTLLAAEKALAYVDVTTSDLQTWFTSAPNSRQTEAADNLGELQESAVQLAAAQLYRAA